MKRQLAISTAGLIILALLTSGAVASSVNIESRIESVTVYPGEATVTRSGAVELPAGDQSVTFENIPHLADVSSFQVSTSGLDGVTILGLNHSEVNHLESQQKRVAELESRIKELEEIRLKEIDDHISVLGDEKNFLMTIGKTGTDEMTRQIAASTIDAVKWEAGMQFFGKKLRLVTDSLRYFSRERADISEKLKLLKEELAKSDASSGNRTRSVQIDVRLAGEGKVKLALTYMLPGASWTPLYDARYDPGTGKVRLDYFAEIVQRTGEDWDDVNITISTSRPSLNAGPGEITISRASIEAMPISNVDDLLQKSPGVVTTNRGEIRIRGGSAGEVSYLVDGANIGDPLGGYGPGGLGNLSSAIQKMIGFDISYLIIRKESIPSGDKSVRCPIAQWDFDAATNYICRPRNVTGVYRQATLTNNDRGVLMPGVVNIFVESGYLGKASVKETIVPGQAFELPFGLDNQITVKREIVSRKKSIFGGQEELSETVKITLKNHAPIPKTISLEEALPVSQHNQIKIKTKDIDPRPASIDEQGRAKWDITLAPDEEKIVTFSYRLGYPRGAVISGL
ncbi:exported hypothetical protein [Candidatus Zixiibacteriota bacterium]|nr:exported hypothetical protein [candidate division Zixibacteria bacterium]